MEGEPLYLYLAVTEYAILEALVREEDKVQWPVYYITSDWLMQKQDIQKWKNWP